ncbi:ABC transporter permease [Corynebacterium lizhenjunii]|uniref:Cell division protein FtsX n=1 Tax=Corynebacterium lizhenjunii TaxID=2709394 RepID=A0A7T0KFA0_9CORY|nr:permease-like cell division protein FtsX [Corynebacterium lizhenjunii]QPK79733.1 ABC transporter permease [Corynebacterium lizhenjunii]
MRGVYIAKATASGLRRNLTMTLALVITSAIAAAFVLLGALVTQMATAAKQAYLDEAVVLVQLEEQISAEDADCSGRLCAQLRARLEQDPAVVEVTFRNRAQSYARFVELFQDQDPDLVADTPEDALPAAFQVRLADPTDASAVTALADAPGVATVSDQAAEARAASRNLDAARTVAFGIAALQAVAALFLIANLVQISAFHRATDLSIMRMVGASRWFSAAPFVAEAALAVLAGVAVAAGAVAAAKHFLIDPALQDLYASGLLVPLADATVWHALPWVAGGSVAGAVAAALVGVAGYVKA